MGINI